MLTVFQQYKESDLTALISKFVAQKQNERINYLSSRNHPNFHEYIKNKGNGMDVPNNCIHIGMAYFVYMGQENCKEDPTEVGRNIKRAHMIVASLA